MQQKQRKSNFVLIVAIVAVILMLVSGGMIFHQGKKLSLDMSGAFGASPAMKQQIIQLNQQFPVDSLSLYALKSVDVEKVILIKKAFAQLLQVHEDTLRGFEDQEEAQYSATLTIMAQARKELLNIFAEYEMSPQMYAWLNQRIYIYHLERPIRMVSVPTDSIPPYRATTTYLQNEKILDPFRTDLLELDTSGLEYWGLPMESVSD